MQQKMTGGSYRTDNKKPVRKKINLYNNKLPHRRIPQIKIQLDEMLDDAYLELRSQPRKNTVIGSPDVFVFPNQILKDYVTSIYDQYSFGDPMVSSKRKVTLTRQRSRSQIQNTNAYHDESFQTPKKYRQQNYARTLNEKSTKNKSKTRQKIQRLKHNFKTQLNSKVDEHDVYEINQPQYQITQMNTHKKQDQDTVKFTKSKSQIYKKISQQEYMKSFCIFPPPMKQPRYCFLCQIPLFTEVQSLTHVSTCKQIAKLQNYYYPGFISVPTALTIMQSKIQSVKQQVIKISNNLQHDLRTLQSKLMQVINNVNNSKKADKNGMIKSTARFKIQQTQNTKQMFMNSNMISCWKLLDKLEWYLQVKKKLQAGFNSKQVIGVKCG